MKTKQKACLCLFIAIFLLFCSCQKSKISTLEQIKELSESFFSPLSNIQVYSSEIKEGSSGFADRTFIAAMLGKNGEFPPEMELCLEYSFFCSQIFDICEAWAVECRTYTAARDVELLFEKRLDCLTKQDYEKESDIAAVSNAKIKRVGKRVYFIASEKAEEMLSYMLK